MTHFEHYISGAVFGIKYIFDTVYDGLPRHSHDTTTAHNIIVLRGEVRVLFDDHTVNLHAGDVYDFDGARAHSILAVSSNTCILNLFLNGQPVEYRTLPAQELKGEFDVRDFNREMVTPTEEMT